MTEYIRRIVSGNKARFKDEKLNLELDLVYVTNNVIIMGYPASGIEGFYRNRREDAKKFLEHRHGKNYWVFNFCPIKENSYDADVFDGRVSRYPFPDHHAPPLAIMPLVAREVHAWLSGSPERVAVFHCKAGKGRSGTMACTYLVSREDNLTSAKENNRTSNKEEAKLRAESIMKSLPDESDSAPAQTLSPIGETSISSDTAGILDAEETGSAPTLTSPLLNFANTEKSFTDSLKGVLDLHTAKRMKATTEGKKVKQGVSIPSQRRWLHYWSLVLAHEAPADLWSSRPSPYSLPLPSGPGVDDKDSVTSQSSQTAKAVQKLEEKPTVRLTEIKLRMRETSSVKRHIVKAANVVMDRAKDSKKAHAVQSGKKANHVWVSLARYDDNLIDLLEKWETYTRDEHGRMGHRRKSSEHMKLSDGDQEHELRKLFADNKWDGGKMVRSFARLGEDGEVKEEEDKDGKILTYTLRPLSDRRWEGIHQDLQEAVQQHALGHQLDVEKIDVPESEVDSVYDVTATGESAKREAKRQLKRGIVLDAGREVRVKLYMGQVFMGWIWFIPTFHMPQPPPISAPSDSAQQKPTSTKFLLTRKEVDFPVGLGSDIMDIEISMEWVTPADVRGAEVPAAEVEPPARALSGDTLESTGETSALAATVQAVVGSTGAEGSGGLREAVEVKQGVEG